jgi:VanZ family protein
MTDPIQKKLRYSQFIAEALTAVRLWRWVLALLLVIVSYLALSPAPPHVLDTGWDKLNHVSAFVALAFAAWLGFAKSQRNQRLGMLALLAYGGAIELIQLFVPGRSCEWGDLLADAIGISLGVLLAKGMTRLNRS